jgi:hypothetical protein
MKTFFLTITYLLNTIKPFSDHENRSSGPNLQNHKKKPLLGGYPKEPEFQNSEYDEVLQVVSKDSGS